MDVFDIFRRPKPKPEHGGLSAGKQQQAVVASLDDWHPRQRVLDDFVVERVLGQSGMGKVYLLKSRTTGMRFAVKRAKGLTDQERRNFLAELQTWIDLPEHVNLVPVDSSARRLVQDSVAKALPKRFSPIHVSEGRKDFQKLREE
jgi:serine/threonine protein kinase